jgi:adenine C2-methylase RlmN of 23S rRNA A2503 and tRNA A37
MNNVNDSNTQARLLIRLLKEVKANVNLIEMNPFPGCPFERQRLSVCGPLHKFLRMQA